MAAEVRALLAQVQCPPAWQHQHAGAVSTWRLTDLSLTTLRQQVQGRWTQAQLLTCLPRLRRFLGESGRQRLQQETTLRRWLTNEALPAVSLLPAAA